MGAKKVHFDLIVDEFIAAINKQLKTEEQSIVVGIDIKTKGTIRELKFYSADTNTGERIVLYARGYKADNVAEFLTKDVNYILYRELFYNCFAYYAMSMESIVKQRAAEKAIEGIEPSIKEHPVKPEDAFEKALKDK